MAEKQEFKLSENLEQLIQNSNTGRHFLDQAEKNPNLDNVRLRNAATNAYQNQMMGHFVPTDFINQLNDERTKSFKGLEENLDESTYKSAKAHYIKGMTDVKEGFYINLLKEGIMPKAPEKDAKPEEKEAYKKLLFAKQTVDVAETIEKYADKGNVAEAIEAMMRYSQKIGRPIFDESDLSSLSRLAAYGAPLARESEAKILKDIANSHRMTAAKVIKEASLYGLIEKGIENTQYGKAIALTEMYNGYNKQQKINEIKAEQAKAGKK